MSYSFLLHCVISFQTIYHLFWVALSIREVSFGCYPTGGCFPLIALNLNRRNTIFYLRDAFKTKQAEKLKSCKNEGWMNYEWRMFGGFCDYWTDRRTSEWLKIAQKVTLAHSELTHSGGKLINTMTFTYTWVANWVEFLLQQYKFCFFSLIIVYLKTRVSLSQLCCMIYKIFMMLGLKKCYKLSGYWNTKHMRHVAKIF